MRNIIEWALCISIIIFALLFLTCSQVQADQCGCTRESDDKICIAYYELTDDPIMADIKIEVTCNQEPTNGYKINKGDQNDPQSTKTRSGTTK